MKIQLETGEQERVTLTPKSVFGNCKAKNFKLQMERLKGFIGEE